MCIILLGQIERLRFKKLHLESESLARTKVTNRSI